MSALIPLFFSVISLTRCGLTEIAFARAYPEILRGFKNSYLRISPGCVAHADCVLRLKGIVPPLIVVDIRRNGAALARFPERQSSLSANDLITEWPHMLVRPTNHVTH